MTTSSDRLREYVEDEKTNLCDGRDGIADAVVLRPKSGTEVAVGLLALGEIDEATEWFAAVSDEWMDSAKSAFEAKYVDGDDEHAQGKQWKQLQRGLQTGILGRVDATDPAETALDYASREFVDDLVSRELEPRIDLVRALGRFLAAGERDVEKLRARVEQTAGHHKEDFNRAYYLPQAAAIEAIDAGDAAAVEDAVDALVDFHAEFVVGAPDTNVVDEAVALDACAYLALAKQYGLDVTVDSEYVPEALIDEEYDSADGS